jgi:Zn-finger nucleic acid-binding protein
MICPKCRQDTLTSFGQMEGVDIDFCSGCKGIWYDKGELAFYVEAGDDVPDLAATLSAGRPAGCACPRCQVELIESHYVPGEPLLIDICPRCHGVFLDRGELPQVEKLAAQRGGLGKVMSTMQALEQQGYAILGTRPAGK